MAILTSVFENQKFDISPRDRQNTYAKMGEELPREGPPSLGALYQPAWALSQKGVGGVVFARTPFIYIYIYIGRLSE